MVRTIFQHCKGIMMSYKFTLLIYLHNVDITTATSSFQGFYNVTVPSFLQG